MMPKAGKDIGARVCDPQRLRVYENSIIFLSVMYPSGVLRVADPRSPL